MDICLGEKKKKKTKIDCIKATDISSMTSKGE